MSTIVIAGSTGTIGSRLVKALSKKPNVTVRGGTRKPTSPSQVELDLDKPETLRAALRGADALFSLIPLGPLHDSQAKALVEASKAEGIKQIVDLSTTVVEGRPIQFGRWHRHAEELIGRSGIAYTLLRPSLFMTDFQLYWTAPDGNIYLPFGGGQVPYIDPQDIADVAAEVLTDARHQRKTYVLTGGEALTVVQVAARLSAAGKPTQYVDVPPEAARAAMTQAGLPAVLVDGFLEMFATVKAGEAAQVTNTVRQVLGRDPATLAQFLAR